MKGATLSFHAHRVGDEEAAAARRFACGAKDGEENKGSRTGDRARGMNNGGGSGSTERLALSAARGDAHALGKGGGAESGGGHGLERRRGDVAGVLYASDGTRPGDSKRTAPSCVAFGLGDVSDGGGTAAAAVTPPPPCGTLRRQSDAAARAGDGPLAPLVNGGGATVALSHAEPVCAASDRFCSSTVCVAAVKE